MIDLRKPAGRGKVLGAAFGAAAVLAMCVVGVASSHDGPQHATVVTAGDMSTGATMTIAYSETEATPSASPAVKAPPYGASG
jgi:hypothetical protein